MLLPVVLYCVGAFTIHLCEGQRRALVHYPETTPKQDLTTARPSRRNPIAEAVVPKYITPEKTVERPPVHTPRDHDGRGNIPTLKGDESTALRGHKSDSIPEKSPPPAVRSIPQSAGRPRYDLPDRDGYGKERGSTGRTPGQANEKLESTSGARPLLNSDGIRQVRRTDESPKVSSNVNHPDIKANRGNERKEYSIIAEGNRTEDIKKGAIRSSVSVKDAVDTFTDVRLPKESYEDEAHHRRTSTGVRGDYDSSVSSNKDRGSKNTDRGPGYPIVNRDNERKESIPTEKMSGTEERDSNSRLNPVGHYDSKGGNRADRFDERYRSKGSVDDSKSLSRDDEYSVRGDDGVSLDRVDESYRSSQNRSKHDRDDEGYRSPPVRSKDDRDDGVYRSPPVRSKDERDDRVYREPEERTKVLRDDEVYRSPPVKLKDDRDDRVYREPEERPKVLRDDGAHRIPPVRSKDERDDRVYREPEERPKVLRDDEGYRSPPIRSKGDRDDRIYSEPEERPKVLRGDETYRSTPVRSKDDRDDDTYREPIERPKRLRDEEAYKSPPIRAKDDRVDGVYSEPIERTKVLRDDEAYRSPPVRSKYDRDDVVHRDPIERPKVLRDDEAYSSPRDDRVSRVSPDRSKGDKDPYEDRYIDSSSDSRQKGYADDRTNSRNRDRMYDERYDYSSRGIIEKDADDRTSYSRRGDKARMPADDRSRYSIDDERSSTSKSGNRNYGETGRVLDDKYDGRSDGDKVKPSDDRHRERFSEDRKDGGRYIDRTHDSRTVDAHYKDRDTDSRDRVPTDDERYMDRSGGTIGTRDAVVKGYRDRRVDSLPIDGRDNYRKSDDSIRPTRNFDPYKNRDIDGIVKEGVADSKPTDDRYRMTEGTIGSRVSDDGFEDRPTDVKIRDRVTDDRIHDRGIDRSRDDRYSDRKDIEVHDDRSRVEEHRSRTTDDRSENRRSENGRTDERYKPSSSNRRLSDETSDDRHRVQGDHSPRINKNNEDRDSVGAIRLNTDKYKGETSDDRLDDRHVSRPIISDDVRDDSSSRNSGRHYVDRTRNQDNSRRADGDYKDESGYDVHTERTRDKYDRNEDRYDARDEIYPSRPKEEEDGYRQSRVNYTSKDLSDIDKHTSIDTSVPPKRRDSDDDRRGYIRPSTSVRDPVSESKVYSVHARDQERPDESISKSIADTALDRYEKENTRFRPREEEIDAVPPRTNIDRKETVIPSSRPLDSGGIRRQHGSDYNTNLPKGRNIEGRDDRPRPRSESDDDYRLNQRGDTDRSHDLKDGSTISLSDDLKPSRRDPSVSETRNIQTPSSNQHGYTGSSSQPMKPGHSVYSNVRNEDKRDDSRFSAGKGDIDVDKHTYPAIGRNKSMSKGDNGTERPRLAMNEKSNAGRIVQDERGSRAPSREIRHQQNGGELADETARDAGRFNEKSLSVPSVDSQIRNTRTIEASFSTSRGHYGGTSHNSNINPPLQSSSKSSDRGHESEGRYDSVSERDEESPLHPSATINKPEPPTPPKTNQPSRSQRPTEGRVTSPNTAPQAAIVNGFPASKSRARVPSTTIIPRYPTQKPLSPKEVIEAAFRDMEGKEPHGEVHYPVYDPRVHNISSPSIIRPNERRGITVTTGRKRK